MKFLQELSKQWKCLSEALEVTCHTGSELGLIGVHGERTCPEALRTESMGHGHLMSSYGPEVEHWQPEQPP